MIEKPTQLRLKEWYNELNSRQKKEIRAIFKDFFGLTQGGFYQLFINKGMDTDKAVVFCQYVSQELFPIDTRDLYRDPRQVRNDYEKWFNTYRTQAFSHPARDHDVQKAYHYRSIPA